MIKELQTLYKRTSTHIASMYKEMELTLVIYAVLEFPQCDARVV